MTNRATVHRHATSRDIYLLRYDDRETVTSAAGPLNPAALKEIAAGGAQRHMQEMERTRRDHCLTTAKWANTQHFSARIDAM